MTVPPCCASPFFRPDCTAFAEPGFLTDYSRLEPVTTPTGTDRLYTAPDAAKRMAGYTRVWIDWPEIHFSADSEYRGMKPQDIQALAQIMCETLKSGGHYSIVAKPAANVLYIRTALTELYLKNKKRPGLAYTCSGVCLLYSATHSSWNGLPKRLRSPIETRERKLKARSPPIRACTRSVTTRPVP